MPEGPRHSTNPSEIRIQLVGHDAGPCPTAPMVPCWATSMVAAGITSRVDGAADKSGMALSRRWSSAAALATGRHFTDSALAWNHTVSDGIVNLTLNGQAPPAMRR